MIPEAKSSHAATAPQTGVGAVELPGGNCYTGEDQIADQHRRGMRSCDCGRCVVAEAGERAVGDEKAEQDTEHGSDDQRDRGEIDRQMPRRALTGSITASRPDQQPDQHEQEESAGDGSVHAGSDCKGCHIQDYCSEAKAGDASPARDLSIGSTRSEHRQQDADHRHRDPPERARVDVGDQQLVARIPDVQPVQDSDDNRHQKDEQCRLVKHPTLLCQRAHSCLLNLTDLFSRR